MTGTKLLRGCCSFQVDNSRAEVVGKTGRAEVGDKSPGIGKGDEGGWRAEEAMDTILMRVDD